MAIKVTEKALSRAKLFGIGLAVASKSFEMKFPSLPDSLTTAGIVVGIGMMAASFLLPAVDGPRTPTGYFKQWLRLCIERSERIKLEVKETKTEVEFHKLIDTWSFHVSRGIRQALGVEFAKKFEESFYSEKLDTQTKAAIEISLAVPNSSRYHHATFYLASRVNFIKSLISTVTSDQLLQSFHPVDLPALDKTVT